MSEAKGEAKAADVFKVELDAEMAQKRLAEEGQKGLENRCPECGSLGSLEEHDDGETRCVDCDVVVARTRSLGGLGRK